MKEIVKHFKIFNANKAIPEKLVKMDWQWICKTYKETTEANFIDRIIATRQNLPLNQEIPDSYSHEIRERLALDLDKNKVLFFLKT